MGEPIELDIIFTFHYGLIKTKNNNWEIVENCGFTFHYGLIKTHSLNFSHATTNKFTFHYGLIKTI